MWLCGLTFELTTTTEVGAVRRDTENVHRTCGPPYSACRSGSALSEGLGCTLHLGAELAWAEDYLDSAAEARPGLRRLGGGDHSCAADLGGRRQVLCSGDKPTN